MKSYELLATDENVLKTFINDHIDRNKEIKYFLTIINSLEGNWSIALDSNWGSGKTFFVKQLKMVLDANNVFIKTEEDDTTKKQVMSRWNVLNHGEYEFKLQPYVSVYYDAWENDNDADPILSIVYQIIKSVDVDFSFSEDFSFKNILEIAGGISSIVTGGKTDFFVNALKESNPHNSLENLRKTKNLKEKVDEFLQSILPERGNKLIIFIDELDRCRPDYAVCLLERIKHYFNNENIIFVFSVNISELQHTIRNYYGNNFDASKYLDRFFDMRLSLPKVNIDRFYTSIGVYRDPNSTYDLVKLKVINVFQMEMREISKFLLLTNMAINNINKNETYDPFGTNMTKRQVFRLFIPVMIGLKLHDMERYNAFVSGTDSQPIIDVFYNDEFLYLSEWLLNATEYTGNIDKEEQSKKYKEFLIDLYDAVFVNEYSDGKTHILGKLRFDNKVKQELMRADSLLSPYMQIDNSHMNNK